MVGSRTLDRCQVLLGPGPLQIQPEPTCAPSLLARAKGVEEMVSCPSVPLTPAVHGIHRRIHPQPKACVLGTVTSLGS